MLLTHREFASLLRFHFEKIAREEESNLAMQGKSVHMMPELAFGYLLGNALFTDVQTLLSKRKDLLEISFTTEDILGKNYPGQCDLVFTIKNKANNIIERHLIEIKMSDKYYAYRDDLIKLLTYYNRKEKEI
jgi:hypothetical protein